MTAPADEIRPGRTGYWVGGALVGVGIVLGAVLFGVALAHSIGEFRELGDDIDAMQRFSVPGEDVVTLDETGEYVLYAEGPVPPVGSVGAAAVTVESTEGDSTPLVLRSVGIDETYDIGDHAGTAALRFTVDEAGDYRVTVGQVPASVTGVAIGPRIDIFGPVGSVFVVIFVPAGVGGVFVIAGAVLLTVTGVRRSGARRRARMAAAPVAPPWGPVPPGAPPPAGGVPPYGPPPGYGPAGSALQGAALPPGLPLSAYPPPGWSVPSWPPAGPPGVPGGGPSAPLAQSAWPVAPGGPAGPTAPGGPSPLDAGEGPVHDPAPSEGDPADPPDPSKDG